MRHGILSVIVLLLFSLAAVKGQTRITRGNVIDIKYEVKETIRNFQDLMSTITEHNNRKKKGRVFEAIDSSFSATSPTRIFYDKNVIIEDDINPSSSSGRTSDVDARKYLIDLNIKFDGDIVLDTVSTSNIKINKYLLIRVIFNSKSIRYPGKNAVTKQREALLRIDSLSENKWRTLLMRVAFYDPSKDNDADEKTVDIAVDNSNRTVFADTAAIQAALAAKQQEMKAKQELLKQQEDVVSEDLANADSLKKKHQFKKALIALKQAKGIRPSSTKIDFLISDIEDAIAADTYDFFKNKAEQAVNDHKYKDAINYYTIASQYAEGKNLASLIIVYTKKYNIIRLPENMLAGGDYKGVIEKCDQLIDAHNGELDAFPELFYFKGVALENTGKTKKAMDCYNTAINYFANYTSALQARAGLNAKNKKYYEAITDYDVIISHTLDTIPAKPGYLSINGKWKALQGNRKDAEVDFNNAIALNTENDSSFFYRGQFSYNDGVPIDGVENFIAAKKDFGAAIDLNPQNKSALYYRGLVNIVLKEYDQAGGDFNEAEKLGIPQDWSKAIDSISNYFFLQTHDILPSHDYSRTTGLLNTALKIRMCNADAWHAKAEISFALGDDAFNRNDRNGAIVAYKTSIAENKKALVCKPQFPDAAFKKGLAYEKISARDSAITSFGDAIRLDENNIQAHVERGKAYHNNENYNAAITDYDQAIVLMREDYLAAKKSGDKTWINSVNFNESKALQLKGKVLYDQHNYLQALDPLKLAIEQNATNAEAIYDQGLVEMALKKRSRAIRSFRAAVALHHDFRYDDALGEAEYKNGEYEKAFKSFSYLFSSDSSNQVKNKRYKRGMSYLKNAQLSDAIADFDDYHNDKNSLNDSLFFADYGIALLLVKQDAAALRSFTRANGSSSKAWFGLGCYYVETGNISDGFNAIKNSFARKGLAEDEINMLEDKFLTRLVKDKAYNNTYQALKKAYFKKKNDSTNSD